MYEIHDTGTIVEVKSGKREIVMRVVYHEDPHTVFLGYRLVQKLGPQGVLELLGIRLMDLDEVRGKVLLNDHEERLLLEPRVLYRFGPSPGRGVGVGPTPQLARQRMDETKGKWVFWYRAKAGDGLLSGVSNSPDQVITDALSSLILRDDI